MSTDRRRLQSTQMWRVGVGIILLTWTAVLLQTQSLLDISAPVSAELAGAAMLVAGVLSAGLGERRRISALAIMAGLVTATAAVTRTSGGSALHAIAGGAGLLVLPLVFALVVSEMERADEARVSHRRLLPFALLAATLALVTMVTWNPLYVPACTRDCLATPLFEPGSAGRIWLRAFTAAFAVLAGGYLGAASVQLARARRGRWSDGRLIIGLGGALTAVASICLGILGVMRVVSVSDGLGASRAALISALEVATAAGLLVVAVGVAVRAWQNADRRLRLRRIAERIEAAPAPGTLESSLSGALDDGTVRVGYWMPEERTYVDADGDTFSLLTAEPGRALTYLERDAQPIAIVAHATDLDTRSLTAGLGPSVLLALDNERLRAVRLARLRELRASRQRIVAVADAERQRAERDLHDGAQQQLLAISIDLRLLRRGAEDAADTARAARLLAAESDALEAIDALRRIARGIYPAVLARAGLVPALRSLADGAAIPVEIETDGVSRLPDVVATAAYELASETLASAVLDGASWLRVRVAQETVSLHVEVSSDGPDRGRGWLERLGDRVGAAGGEIFNDSPPSGGMVLRAVLPCG